MTRAYMRNKFGTISVKQSRGHHKARLPLLVPLCPVPNCLTLIVPTLSRTEVVEISDGMAHI